MQCVSFSKANGMKNIILFIMGAILCACAANRQNAAVTNDSGKNSTPVAEATETVAMPHDETQSFATALFKTVNSNCGEENLCISPASAMWAIAMTANGAEGNTAKQMYAALGYPTAAEQRAAFNTLQKNSIETAENNEKAVVNIANSIWIKNTIKLKEPFIASNKLFYDAEVKHTTFDDAAVTEINNWCSEKTNGKINSILNESNPATLLMLINALYFNGKWANPFDKEQTKKAPFTKADGEVVEVDMMHQQRRATYYKDDIMQVTLRPFLYNEYYMMLVLPREGVTIEQAADALADRYEKIDAERADCLLHLGMPKFKNEFGTSLKATLQAMGMEDAFTDKARFDGISKTPLRIDDVVQKTYIAVDEEGAEAAAITYVALCGMSMMRPQEPKTMIMDRPFIYAIKDRRSGDILFMGKVGNPNK